MEGDIGTWFRGIPLITRYWFLSFFVVPLTTRLGLIDPRNLVLFPQKVTGEFQVSSARLAQCLHIPRDSISLTVADMATINIIIMASSQLQLANDAVFLV